MRTLTSVIALLAACFALPSCVSGIRTDLEGVYEVTEWTLNDAGCDAAGPSVAAQRSPYIGLRVVTPSFFGVDLEEVLDVVTCSDISTCSGTANLLLTPDDSLEDGSDSAGWTGEHLSSSRDGDNCDATQILTSLESPSEGEIEYALRTTIVTYGYTEVDGCPLEPAEALLEDEPCGQLEAISAEFVQAFE